MRLTVTWEVCCSSGRVQLGGLYRFFTEVVAGSESFDRELTAVFSALRQFRFMVEGRQFHVMTDHKPLVAAFGRVSPPWSARQQRQLAYITKYTTDIRHTPGASNAVADTLSRPGSGQRCRR
jgi:RNase H-like domain found in reverse transcriptase